MNHSEIVDLVAGLAPAIRDYIQEAITPVCQRIAAIEARITALEARPAVRYVGVWSDGRQYVEGNLTTWAGSLWICHTPTTTKPGGDCWQLIVKNFGTRSEMTEEETDKLVDVICSAMRLYIAKELAPLKLRIASLETTPDAAAALAKSLRLQDAK